MTTIASQLYRSVVPGIVLTLLIGGIVLDLLIGDRLENEFDAVLVNKARTLAALTEYESGALEIERYDHVLPRYADSTSPDYFEIRSEAGKRMLASPALTDSVDLADGREGDKGWRPYAELRLPDGRAGRRFTLTFKPVVDAEEPDAEPHEAFGSARSSPDDSTAFSAAPVVLTVAVSREPLDALLDSVHLSLLLTGSCVMIVLFLLARRAIRSRLAPLSLIGRQIEALTIDHPEQRLALDPSSEEIDRLTARFNELLERVDLALERERRFSGDVAHELRTPIAELKSLLEVRARFPKDAELAAHFEDDQFRAVERMERTVTQLLALGRAEAHREPIGPDVELDELIEACVERVRAKADQRHLLLETVLGCRDRAVAGEHYWQGIADNLLQNAVAHATSGSTVRIVLDAFGDGCRLRVENRCADLERADLDRMFDRLWRKEASRTSTHHSGLGLALVNAYARALGLVVVAELLGDRLVMTVRAADAAMPSRRQDVAASPPLRGAICADVPSVLDSSAL